MAFFVDPVWKKVWRRHVGHTTNDDEMVERLNRYFDSEAGTRLVQGVGSALVEDSALEQMLVDLLDHPDLTRVLRKHALALLRDPGFIRAADAALLSVFRGRPLEEQRSRLRALLITQSVQDAVAGVFADAAREPRLNAVMVGGLLQMVENLRVNVSLARELGSIEI